MTEKTNLLDSKADTRISVIPGPPVRHLPRDFQVPPNPAVHHKPTLEAANESYSIYHPRAFSRSAQEEHHAKTTFRQEYIRFLKRYEIDHDERFIFKPAD